MPLIRLICLILLELSPDILNSDSNIFSKCKQNPPARRLMHIIGRVDDNDNDNNNQNNDNNNFDDDATPTRNTHEPRVYL